MAPLLLQIFLYVRVLSDHTGGVYNLSGYGLRRFNELSHLIKFGFNYSLDSRKGPDNLSVKPSHPKVVVLLILFCSIMK